jgi:hypothetical protein
LSSSQQEKAEDCLSLDTSRQACVQALYTMPSSGLL